MKQHVVFYSPGEPGPPQDLPEPVRGRWRAVTLSPDAGPGRGERRSGVVMYFGPSAAAIAASVAADLEDWSATGLDSSQHMTYTEATRAQESSPDREEKKKVSENTQNDQLDFGSLYQAATAAHVSPEAGNRAFWPADYARLGDALRRARKGKTPAQLQAVNQLIAETATVLSKDYADFDVVKFAKSALLRVETVHFQEFAKWAEARGMGEVSAIDAPQSYTEFYKTRFETVSGDDAPAYGEDDDEDDDEDEGDEPGSGE